MATGYDGRGARFNVVAVEDNDLSFTVTAVDGAAAAVDLSAATITANIYNGAGTVVDTFTDTLSGAGSNVITLSLTDSEVDALTEPKSWALVVERGGDARTWLAGSFTVSDAARARVGTSGTAVTATVDTNVVVTAAVLTSVGGVTTLDSLTDVTITTPVAGNALVYNGTVWANAVPAGGGDMVAANNLSDVVNKSTGRTNLGVAIGVDVQAYDADLAALAAAGNSATLANVTAAYTTAEASKLAGIAAGATDDTTVNNHISDTTDAHDASAISVADVATIYTATDVEAALAEVKVIADAAVTPAEAAAAYQPLATVLTNTTASYTTALDSKLAGIEAGADVTDATNVTAAGALMDSEVDANLKTLALPASTTISTYGASLVDDADASTARTTLGLAIGTDVQAYSSVLANTTASFTTADKSKLDGIEAGADVTDTTNVTAAGALMDSEVDANLKTLALPANTTISTFGASLVDDADAAAARTTLGLGNAATLTVDADLATLALPASTTISTFGASVVDDADAAAARTTLGLGTMATATATDYVAKSTFPDSVSVALSDMTTQITTGATKAYWVNPFDAVLTITKVKATLATAGSGATVVDINEGAGAGTSILSTKITIDASETDSDDAAAPVVSDSSIAADGRLTFDIDTAGTDAAGLMVHIMFTRPI